MNRPGRLFQSNVVIAVSMFALGLAGVTSAQAVRHASLLSATVSITDSKLTVSPASLPAGQVVFTVFNRGHKAHSFAIKGPGLKQAKTDRDR